MDKHHAAQPPFKQPTVIQINIKLSVVTEHQSLYPIQDFAAEPKCSAPLIPKSTAGQNPEPIPFISL